MALGPFLQKRVRERGLNEAYFKDLKVGRRDKEARARAIQGRMQQGMVYFPKDPVWVGPLIAELLRFPNGVHDDQVDAMVMAIHYMKDSWHLQHPHDPYYSDNDNTYKKNKATYWKVSN